MAEQKSIVRQKLRAAFTDICRRDHPTLIEPLTDAAAALYDAVLRASFDGYDSGAQDAEATWVEDD